MIQCNFLQLKLRDKHSAVFLRLIIQILGIGKSIDVNLAQFWRRTRIKLKSMKSTIFHTLRFWPSLPAFLRRSSIRWSWIIKPVYHRRRFVSVTANGSETENCHQFYVCEAWREYTKSGSVKHWTSVWGETSREHSIIDVHDFHVTYTGATSTRCIITFSSTNWGRSMSYTWHDAPHR